MMPISAFEIENRTIGINYPCFIIAEAGVNHNGDLQMARDLIDAAAEAGADAVKFQTFTAEGVVTHRAPKAAYQEVNALGDESQYAMLKRLELTPAMHDALLAHCKKRDICFLSSPFDEGSLALLESLGVAAYKIPSGEITNLPFLDAVGRKGRPVICSTGMATLAEVELAVATLQGSGCTQLVLLHCVNRYPALPEEINLRAMNTLTVTFNLPVGYSDHTMGNEIAFAAVALGACVLEKHLTLDRALPGPDHLASSEPYEFAALVRGVRAIEIALGHGRKEPTASEVEIAAVARKSLVAAVDIPAGMVLIPNMLAIKRPGSGLPPAMYSELLGRITRVPVPAGTLLTLEMLI